MKILAYLIISVFLFTGCATKDTSLSLDTQKTDISLKNSKNITLYLTQRDNSTSNHSVRPVQAVNSFKINNNIEHIRIALKEEGFTLTNYKKDADYVFILDEASAKTTSFPRNSPNAWAGTFGTVIYNTKTLTLKFLLTQPNNVSIYRGTLSKIKKNADVNYYSDSISWQIIGKHPKDYWYPEKFQKNYKIVRRDEIANFPKAYKIITKKILVQMDQEYVFDD